MQQNIRLLHSLGIDKKKEYGMLYGQTNPTSSAHPPRVKIMKAYINHPIIIKRPIAVSNEDIEYTTKMWARFLEKMDEFDEKFTIFSGSKVDGELVISAQKINLDEKDMCEFLYFLDWVLFDEFDMCLTKRFGIEDERICVTLEAIYN